MILRPSKVPREARYSIGDGWWQVGDVIDGTPTGAWQTWRPDGSRLFEARFDAKGRLHGVFKRFHPDGSLAREARYSKGRPIGKHLLIRAKGASDDVFPSTDPRVSRLALRFEDGKEIERTPLDERGVEVVDRVDEPPGVLDPVFAAARPDGFLASGVLPRILSTFEAAGPAPVDHFLLPVPARPRRPLDGTRFQELYGMPMPAALERWCEAFASEPALFGMRITRDAELVTDGNMIEALIAEHQEAPHRSDGLAALVSGLIPLGTGGGLRYCVAICETPDAPSDAVYPLNPQDDAIQIPCARTLDDWAYTVVLLTALERRSLSTPCARQAFERLRGRIDLRPPMEALEARLLDDGVRSDDEVTGDPEGDHAEGFHFRRADSVAGYFFYRNRWLLRLLAGNPEGAAAIYKPSMSELDDARFERICAAVAQPWVAFYWAFWMLAFDDARLPRFLAAAAAAPSQLARDVAALVEALRAGRTRLGILDDLPGVLARFRALDPAANKEGDEGDQSDDEEPAEGEDESEAEAEELPEELAAAGAVIEWAKRGGFRRENLIMDYELDVAALGLALRADPTILPHLASVLDEHPWEGYRLLIPWIDGDRGDLAALAPQARAWLTDRGTGSVYRWMAGARLLARVGTPADGKLIGDRLEPALDQLFGRGFGFEAAMGTMILEEAVGVLCEAIQRLELPETTIAALEGVASAENHLVDDVRGPCALALASVGRGLDAIVTGLRGQASRGHGHRITAGQLEALGMFGAREPARRDELRTLLASLTKLGDEAELGAQLARHDLGEASDLAAAVRAALTKPRYQDDREDAAKKRAELLAIVGRRRDLPAELAVPYVQSEHPVLQLAALHVLKQRGIAAPPIDLFDPYRVAALGRDGVHAALAAGTGLHLGNLALWIGEHPDETSREPLIAFARSLAKAPGPFPAEGPRHYALYWTVHALIQLGGADKLCDELLLAEDRELADPVLRFCDRLGPGIARGMVHVLVEDQHWRVSTARAWLRQRKSDPRIAAALAEHGLAIEDVTRTPKDAE